MAFVWLASLSLEELTAIKSATGSSPLGILADNVTAAGGVRSISAAVYWKSEKSQTPPTRYQRRTWTGEALSSSPVTVVERFVPSEPLSK